VGYLGGLPPAGEKAHHRILHPCNETHSTVTANLPTNADVEKKALEEKEKPKTNQVQVVAPLRRPQRRAVLRRRARRGTAWAGEGPCRGWGFAGGEELGFGSGRGGGEGAAAAASLLAAAEAASYWADWRRATRWGMAAAASEITFAGSGINGPDFQETGMGSSQKNEG
jgi:hypothetical protein